MNDLAKSIENLLRNSKEPAVKKKQLVALIARDERVIRETIEDMRHNSHLILSDGKGYRYAKDFEDYEKWAKYMYKYIQSLSHTVRLVGDCAVSQFGKCYQPPLFRG